VATRKHRPRRRRGDEAALTSTLAIAAALLAGQPPAGAAQAPPPSEAALRAQEEERLVRWWREQGISEAGVQQLRARQRVEAERTAPLYAEGTRLFTALKQAASGQTLDAPRIAALLRRTLDNQRALAEVRAATLVDEFLAVGEADRKILLQLIGYRGRLPDPSRPMPIAPPAPPAPPPPPR
jgi:hypothetical protein